MIIAYDVSHIQSHRGGMGGYTLALLRRVLQADTANRYILHGWAFSLDMDVLKDLVSPRCTICAHRIPGVLKRAYWERYPLVPLNVFTGPFDIFHSGDPFFPPVGRRKVVITLHDLLARSHPGYFEPSIVKRDSRMGPWIAGADAVVVPSRFTGDQLSASGLVSPDRIHVIPYALPPEFGSEGGSQDQETLSRYRLLRPYILSAGTIEPRKNIAGLVSAFEHLCSEGFTGADLVIAGKLGWMSGDFPERVMKSPFAGRIRWLRYVPGADLRALYRRALCFVYPSFAEGYGLPVAEAMACGVPVVTSNSSGMAEAAGGAAVFVDPRSIPEISGAISAVAGDPAMRSRLRDAGLKRAGILRSAFDPHALIRVYESLVQK